MPLHLARVVSPQGLRETNGDGNCAFEGVKMKEIIAFSFLIPNQL